MKFSKDELGIIYQYASDSKEKTVTDLKQIVPLIKQVQVRAVVESTIEKLNALPEKACEKFMADTKAAFLRERDKSIRQRLNEAKPQTKEPPSHRRNGKCPERGMSL